jgi:hypothetical protein
MTIGGTIRALATAALLAAALAAPASAQLRPGKLDPDGLDMDKIRAMLPEYFHPTGNGRTAPADIPDVFGPGAVLTAGNLFMKVTNFGHCGNFFTNLSNDPAGQWPGASGIEYLSTIRLAVAGKNPQATDPTAIRRVSYLFEWRPPTLDPVDRIYRAYDGIINGQRYINDDNDSDPVTGFERIDEDFLDGHDNDGDGKIDEDYGAVGQVMYSCLMRDDTPQAINATFNEKHVPLGLEVRQLAWSYSIPGFQDFDIIEYTIFNRSGHTLDSLCVGWLADIDVGPLSDPNFFRNDFDLPLYPHGEFTVATLASDKRLQDPTMRDVSDPTDPPSNQVPKDSSLCPRYKIRINGFSQAQAPGQLVVAPGIPTFLLINHTTDPLGISAPARVGFTAFRSFTAGTPYNQGGNPIVDQQRYEFMEGTQPNGLGDDGFINTPQGDQKGDYVEWCSTGPYRNVPDGGSVQATIALAVRPGTYQLGLGYESDYERFLGGSLNAGDLISKYPSLDNAIAVQIAYDGVWERRDWKAAPGLTNGHGRETPLIAARGTGSFQATPDCHDAIARTVTELKYDWFDYDCDYCTGAYDSKKQIGMFHHTWNTDAPPPNPNTNLGTAYNFTDNPARKFPPIGDHQITVAWDNLSEMTPNPRTDVFGFRGYKLWKVAGWTRPVGSSAPSDDDWSLLGEFDFFNYQTAGQWIPNNMVMDTVTHTPHCPQVFIPNYYAPDTGFVGPRTVPICLTRGDVWDHQTGVVLHPDTTMTVVDSNSGCVPFTNDCTQPQNNEIRNRYPVGRYRFVDKEVKNGFLYFYSVTAFDSSFTGLELNGRRSTSEAEGVSPQISVRTGKSVWVVPNPYRGYRNLTQRPSAWDLTPNASDPTGTHIDFMGLPRGNWTIRIYTVSGDKVAELKSSDAINESLRAPVTDKNNNTYPGYNRQQDSANDGEARWNLISRNGQDVVSGIYIFTVQSSAGIQRGKFVVIR